MRDVNPSRIFCFVILPSVMIRIAGAGADANTVVRNVTKMGNIIVKLFDMTNN
jgi:hypothetical protein